LSGVSSFTLKALAPLGLSLIAKYLASIAVVRKLRTLIIPGSYLVGCACEDSTKITVGVSVNSRVIIAF
jgi:hypothetical protein